MINRILTRLVFACTVVLGVLISIDAGAQAVSLATPQGMLEGATSERFPEIAVFKNIPYALPPVGQRRWQHAQRAPGWQGTRLATDFSPACLQPPYPPQSFYARAATPTSEDCLYLNVWSARSAFGAVQGAGTESMSSAAAASSAQEDDAADADSADENPVATKPAGLPVMVWIHGGALTRGSGSLSTYNGAALAARGVVLVTINYRLGVFGYLAHPEASAESTFGVSGNYGTSDQVAALEWVRDNIAAFGGDPNNVTIFGESAGSWSVHHMLATPRAKGLFHRAIGQSGARFGPMLELRGDASSAHAQGIKLQTMLGADSLGELRDLDSATVLKASQQQRFGGVRDGVIFPEQLYEMFAAHRYNVVPLMVGYNADEGTTLGVLQNLPESAAAYRALLRRQYGDQARNLLTVYPAAEPRASALALFRDVRFGYGMHVWARSNSQKQPDTYFYYFTHKPYGDPLGAYHAAEIPYVFDNVPVSADEEVAITGAAGLEGDAAVFGDAELANLMADYWVAFATTGRPEVEGAPVWPRYSVKKPVHLEFSSDGAVRGRNSLGKRWKALDALGKSLRAGNN